jgi:sulfur carrier protein
MQIYVNDEPVQTEQNQTVAAFLSQINIDKTKRLAIAINNTVIPQGDWPDYQLQADDRLLLIAPVSGG